MGRNRAMQPGQSPLSRWSLVFWMAMLALGGWTQGGLFRPTEFEASAARLTIKGDPYGRSFPLGELHLDLARIVDLEQEPDYRPWLKTNGIGLPAYRSGWHRLRDREKALVFLAQSSQAVYLPTTRGHAILITADRPGELLDALRHPGAAPRVFGMPGGR